MSAPMPPIEPPPTPSDILLGRIIVILGVVSLADMGLIGFLAYSATSIPDALVLTLGSSVTGLAGLLAGRRP